MTVYKLDRFSRNKYEMAIHRKHLKDNGIKILSAMENIPELSVFEKAIKEMSELGIERLEDYLAYKETHLEISDKNPPQM